VLLTFQHAYEFSTFRKGVNYLLLDRFHQFHNSDILYANIQRAVNEDHGVGVLPDVATTMRTWEMQAGYPVVTVSRSGNTLTITQERFMYDRELTSNNLWWIPLNYVVGSDPDFSSTRTDVWMNPVRSITVNNNNAPKPWQANDWIIFNIQARSYIRVNYDDTLWQLIINQLNAPNRGFERIYFRNRGQLIDDAHHLARGDRTNFGIVLGLIEYMWQETDHVAWMAANRAFNFITPRLSGSKVFPHYQEFIRKAVQTLFDYLTVQWKANEPRLDRLSRPIAVNLACRHRLPECLNRTNEELSAFIFNGRRVEVENRPAIYCNGLRTGNALLFLSMQNRLLRTVGNQGERNTIIDGMACTENSDLLTIHLNLGITPGIALSTAEKLRVLTAPATNGESSVYTTMEFIESKYDLIIAEAPNFLPSMLNTIANNVASETLYSRFMLLMAELLCRNAISSDIFTQHLNGARAHLEWQSVNMHAIKEFFNSRNY
jgi:aminopeptidase N